MSRLGEMERGFALASAKREIAGRIRHVCEHYSEAEFADLVGQMAEIEVRYRLRDDWGVFCALADEHRAFSS